MASNLLNTYEHGTDTDNKNHKTDKTHGMVDEHNFAYIHNIHINRKKLAELGMSPLMFMKIWYC